MVHPALRAGRLLVVDDDDGTREFFVATLRLEGYEIEQAANLAEAVGVIETTPLIGIVLDVRLPDGTGIELVDRLRRSADTETLPVLLVTGDDHPDLETTGLDAGATDFIIKPITPDALAARVRAHLRDRAMWLSVLERERASSPDDDVRDLSALERLLQRRAFSPVFQPIVDLREKATKGHEALTRFDDGTPPDQWFGRASRLGGRAALEIATLAAAVEGARHLPASSYLTLNVSPSVLVDAAAEMREILEGASQPIVLEITEHQSIDDYAAVLAAVPSLHPAVRLSVDDAGAGWASLRHVLKLSPAFVKLDREWVRGIDDDPACQALVAGLVHFAHQTDCTLVAEGIETDAELDTLIELGVQTGQGFLLGRPEPVG